MFTYQILNLKNMKTMNHNKSQFPKPFRFTVYLIVVTVVGFMNWMATNANDGGIETTLSLESRLAEALVPLTEKEPELEDWILSLSENIGKEGDESASTLESRLAEALETVADPEPELEDWIMNLSDDILSGDGE
jgi:hypothetical protein